MIATSANASAATMRMIQTVVMCSTLLTLTAVGDDPQIDAGKHVHQLTGSAGEVRRRSAPRGLGLPIST